jgi:hypothetical protein
MIDQVRNRGGQGDTLRYHNGTQITVAGDVSTIRNLRLSDSSHMAQLPVDCKE